MTATKKKPRPAGKAAPLAPRKAGEKDPFLLGVGSRIRAVRSKQQLAQETLAPMVPVERAYMGALERGERNMSLIVLARVALALDVEISTLVPSLSELKKLLPPLDEPPGRKRRS
jgi:transcriptional regulator with XRE-family HTH domain